MLNKTKQEKNRFFRPSLVFFALFHSAAFASPVSYNLDNLFGLLSRLSLKSNQGARPFWKLRPAKGVRTLGYGQRGLRSFLEESLPERASRF